MSFNHIDSLDTSAATGAGGSTVTPEQLKFAAGAASAGLGGAGAFVIGAVAPIPAAVTIAGIGGCLYAAYRMENGLPIIPGRGDDSSTTDTPTLVDDVIPVSA